MCIVLGEQVHYVPRARLQCFCMTNPPLALQQQIKRFHFRPAGVSMSVDGPLADVGEVHFNVCFEGVKRKSSRSVVTSAYDPQQTLNDCLFGASRGGQVRSMVPQTRAGAG